MAEAQSTVGTLLFSCIVQLECSCEVLLMVLEGLVGVGERVVAVAQRTQRARLVHLTRRTIHALQDSKLLDINAFC